MASVQVASITASLAEDGMSNGRIKLSALDGFVLNAYCYLISSTQPSTPCLILGTDATGNIILGKAAEIGVRGNNYGLLDTTPFLVADNAQLSMPAQIVSAIINLSQSDSGGVASGGDIIPSYVPSGNLLMGNNFSPMHLIPPGASGSILVSDGNAWYAASGSANGVMSVTATSPLASTGGENPILSIGDSGVSPNTYGSATKVAKFTVDAKGRITSAEEVEIAGSINDFGLTQWFGVVDGGVSVDKLVAVEQGTGHLVVADNSDITKVPCIGSYALDSDNNPCVRSFGFASLGGTYGSGVEVYLGTNGNATANPPSSSGTFSQYMGVSVSSNQVSLIIGEVIEN